MLVFLHIVGFALLFGSIAFYKSKNNALVLWLIILQFVSGVLLVVLGSDANHTKVAYKTLLLVLIGFFVFWFRNKQRTKEIHIVLVSLVVGCAGIAILR